MEIVQSILIGMLATWNLVPDPLRAAVGAWALAISVTQPFKFLLPLSWPTSKRHICAQAVAFSTALISVIVLWPEGGVWAGLLGVITGIWAPMAYWTFILIIEDRWPALADALSADVRGVLIGEGRHAQLPRPR